VYVDSPSQSQERSKKVS